ncbi:MAG: CGNR zinc finger domain-containing protein [Terrimesophilobacter sp.]
MSAEPLTGQRMSEDDGSSWWFDAGSIALDFAHTGGFPRTESTVARRSSASELLQSPADLGRWLSERLPRVDPAVSERELSDALGLRAAIASIALSIVRRERPTASDIDIVNLFAAMPDIPPTLTGGTRQAGAGQARTTQALSLIARDAVSMFGDEAARLRQCAASDCELVYVDTSRSGNRRWCSMQRCGNRAKVRAHRARARR